jgi:Mrp family chromosome partitioning ATPase
MADGLLLVVNCGRTTQDQAKAALLTLEKAGITPLGVVMNQVDRRKGYGHYYSYYHSH